MNPSGNSRRRRSNPTTGGGNNSEVVSSFTAFLEAWLVRQHHYLDELQSATQSRDSTQEAYLEDLVDRVLSHYQQYYDEKSRVAQRDATVLFASPWLTCLERSSLWVAGFKPGLAVELALASLGGELTGDQAWRMEELRVRTRVKEKELNDEVAQLQESAACAPVLEALRRCARMPRDGLVGDASEALGALRDRMEAAVANADSLRMRTALAAMEILSPGQRVKLLTAAAELQLKIRSLGLQRDAERRWR